MDPRALAEFCARLACGLAAVMALVPPPAVSGSYRRTVMLVVLGLAVLAAMAGPGLARGAGPWLLGSAVLAFLGYAAASVEAGAAERPVAGLLAASTAVALVLIARPPGTAWRLLDLVALAGAGSSALLLGSMMAAMLLGHSYLVSPTMSIAPLRRMVGLIAASLAARAATAATGLLVALRGWAGPPGPSHLDGFWWSLVAARWLVGLAGPAVLVWMAWDTARIRSTQSATGILYVGVILTFFGELIGQLMAVRLGLAV